jgi:outer membrane protein with beta-barrel domain
LPEAAVVSRAVKLVVLSSVMLMLASAPARADWQIAPFFGFTFKGSTTIVDLEDGASKVHWHFGGTGTLIGRGPIGVEGIFVYTPHFFQADNVGALATSKTLALMGNVVLAAPLSWNEYGLRPFVSGGLGLMHASQLTTDPRAFPISENLLGYNVGGGAIGFVTERTGLRFDLRYYSSLSRTDETGVSSGPVQLRYWTGAVGVVFKL